MFAAKLWFPVVLLVVAGATMLVLGTTKFSETLLPPYEAMAAAAKSGVEGELVEASQKTLDQAAKLAAHPDVRAALRAKAEPNEVAKTELLAAAEGRFGAPAYALLVRSDGTVHARLGADSVELGEQLEGLPLVAEALRGFGRDGLLTIGGKAVHAVAYPVYDGGSAVGAVVLGWPYEAAFFQKLSEETHAKVALLLPKERLGPALDDVADEDLRQLAAEGVLGAASTGLPGGAPWLVPGKERWLAAKTPLYAGDRSSSVVVAVDRTPAFAAIGLAQLAVLALTTILGLMFAIIIGSTLRSISRPMQAIMDHLSAFQQGSTVGILPESALSGPFVRLGKQINMILQMMPAAARAGGAAPLSSIGSGPVAAGPGFNGALGGALGGGLGGALGAGASAPPAPSSDLAAPTDGNGLRLDALLGDAPPPPPSSPASMPGAGSSSPGFAKPPGTGAGVSSSLSNLFDDAAPDPLAAFRVPGGSPPPPAPSPAPPSSPAVPLPGGAQAVPLPGGAQLPANSPPMTSEATVMFQVPQELIERSSSNTTIPPPGKRPPSSMGAGMPAVPPPQPAPRPGPMMDDNRTVVAQVPHDLLAAAAPKSDITAADEAHYREVYDKFVSTRQECGEDISDLTYDRFVQKLLKNRQQILEKHKAKSVRFQVYVKDGKAALRALPVRD